MAGVRALEPRSACSGPYFGLLLPRPVVPWAILGAPRTLLGRGGLEPPAS